MKLHFKSAIPIRWPYFPPALNKSYQAFYVTGTLLDSVPDPHGIKLKGGDKCREAEDHREKKVQAEN